MGLFQWKVLKYRVSLGSGEGLSHLLCLRYGDKMRNGYGDKMRHFNEFFASFLRFCVFDLCFFVTDATSY